MDFIQNDIAYGAMPDQQSHLVLNQNHIHELTPGHREVVALYWHSWNIESELLLEFGDQLRQGFQKVAVLKVKK